MRNTVKLILILCLCVGLLAMVGCKNQPADTTGTTATTVPEETTQETTQETTTEKPVNIVEDPMNNGEGDPLDAIDGTTDSTKPGIDIDVDAGGNESTTPTDPNGGNQGGETGTTTPSQGGNTGASGDDDFVLDFGDLTGGK